MTESFSSLDFSFLCDPRSSLALRKKKSEEPRKKRSLHRSVSDDNLNKETPVKGDFPERQKTLSRLQTKSILPSLGSPRKSNPDLLG